MVATLLLGGAMSVGLGLLLQGKLESEAAARVHQQASILIAGLEQRLEGYGDLLQVIQPLLALEQRFHREEAGQSAWSQHLPHHYPGVVSLTLVRRMRAEAYTAYRQDFMQQLPAGLRADESAMPVVHADRQWYTVIDQAWPNALAAKLLGAEVADQTESMAVHDQLVPVPSVQMSAPMHFRQMAPGTQGVLVSLPLFAAPDAQGQRELAGWVNLGIQLDALVDDMRTKGMLRHIQLQVRDVGPSGVVGTAPDPEGGWLYAPDGDVGTVVATAQHEVPFFGRRWQITLQGQPGILTTLERSYPWWLGGACLLGTALLAALVALLARHWAKALRHTNAKRRHLLHRIDRLNALFHQSAVGVAEMDPVSGRLVSVNARVCDILGASEAALTSMSWYDMLDEADRAQCQAQAAEVTAGHQPHYTRVQRMQLPHGREVWTELWASPLWMGDAKPTGNHIVVLQDVTLRQRMHAQLQAREADSSDMLRHMPVGLVVVGGHGQIALVNQQFALMTGWSQDQIPDETTLWRSLCVDQVQLAALLRLLNTGRCEVVALGMVMQPSEYLLRRRDGTDLPVELSARFLGDRILLTFVDLSLRKEAEAEILRLGYYDPLTQLPNRRLLLDRVAEALQHCSRRGGGCGALLLLDIDNFKSLNETRGHQYGDALLRLVAMRLTHCLSGKYTLARQGGDEFGLVLEELPADPLDAGSRAEQVGSMVLEALRTPFMLGGQELYVTVSMGAVVFRGAPDTVEELLKRADLALYQAKSNGRDSLQFFDPSMQKAVSERVEMDKDLRLALDRHEFDLYYQPQVERGRVLGAEALLRWKHPTKGMVSPSIFVPPAEESGLILPLGEWVLYAACRQLAQWARDPQLCRLSMSVNVSPRQFYQAGFVQQVQQALQVTGARADLLELELTEGMLLTDVDDTIEKMVQLKAMGVMFSLDDFGTGYSSLSYLKRLPLDKLKIDQSFVREVLSSPNDASIARTVVALGHSLGLQVVAEGVETPAQRDFLAASGCRTWQGFLFSRPLPAADFVQWVHRYVQACLPIEGAEAVAPVPQVAVPPNDLAAPASTTVQDAVREPLYEVDRG